MNVSGCEWKIRYEMQVEMKQLFEMQTAVLNDKVDEAKRTVKEGNGLVLDKTLSVRYDHIYR